MRKLFRKIYYFYYKILVAITIASLEADDKKKSSGV